MSKIWGVSNMKALRSATPLALAILLCTMLFVLFGTSEKGHAKKVSSDATQDSYLENVFLQGFSPLSEVSYSVFSGGVLIIEGARQADKDGNLKITHDSPSEDFQTHIVYNFNIENEGEYLDLKIRMNLTSRKIEMSGNGVEEFSEIMIVTPKEEIRTKSDWSGAFAENDILTSRDDIEFEIALHGMSGIAPPQKKQNPAIIKVLSAQGGGGPNSGGVNKYKLKQIKTPLPPLSVDSDAHIQDTITQIIENYVTAMQMMAEQLSAVVMQSTMAIGTFFDAKHQLETQREIQLGTIQAHKDYHPSEEMCKVGTFMRSIANTEQKANADRYALNQTLMSRYKNQELTASGEGASAYMQVRIEKFRTTYCDRTDSNNGLDYMCEHDQNEDIAGDSNIGGSDPERINKDIDFFRTVEMPGTLEIDFGDATIEADEEDVIALAQNLYWPKPFTYPDDKRVDDNYPGYFDAQRVVTLNSIASSTFTNLAAMKARAKEAPAGAEPGWLFMKVLMKDFGITDDEINRMIGEEPSYWAQMDVLTKKMYQLPNFYTNLYDKPVNVERMSVALEAIKLMQMRDHYTSMLRREMLSSAQLEAELQNSGLYNQAATGLGSKLK